MTSPADLDNDNQEDSSGESEATDYTASGATSWYQTVDNLISAMEREYGEEVAEDQVEEFLTEALGIESPSSEFLRAGG